MRSRYGTVCPTIRSRLFLLLATFSIGFFVVPSAHAATYYVATNGSDSGSGSQVQPWQTISRATSKLSEGDTIYVRGGVYNETGNIRISKSNVKLLNAPGESPVINCASATSSHGIFVQSTEKMSIAPDGDITEAPIGNITIEGFEIRNCGATGMRLNSVHDAIIRRNWIHHNKHQGILGDMLRAVIDRNVISNNGHHDNLDHGLYLTGSNLVITNNLIYGNASTGVHMAGYPWDLSLYNSKLTGRRGATPEYAGAANWLIANNTFAYQGSVGIVIWQKGSANSRIFNNIFYENGVKKPTQGVGFTVSTGSGHVIENNICHSSKGKACISNSGAGRYTGSNNITANPNFEGAGATLSGVPNFKLLAGSPAIDKVQTPATTWDHAGGARPYGAAPDIGAYEFGSPPNSGSPPPNPTGGGITPPSSGGGLGNCYK